jgi:hypothetical protein
MLVRPPEDRPSLDEVADQLPACLNILLFDYMCGCLFACLSACMRACMHACMYACRLIWSDLIRNYLIITGLVCTGLVCSVVYRLAGAAASLDRCRQGERCGGGGGGWGEEQFAAGLPAASSRTSVETEDEKVLLRTSDRGPVPLLLIHFSSCFH